MRQRSSRSNKSRNLKASKSTRSTSNASNSSTPKRQGRKKIPWAALFLLMFFMWIGYRQLVTQFSQPQAILVLGGSPDREKFAAELALEHPKLPVWVSSGSPKEYSEWVFDSAGVESDRIHLDYRAVDTLTNFTTLVDDLKAEGITSFYLVTSDYHMRRAQWIAEVIGSNRGVVFKTVPIPSDRPSEPMIKAFRDSGRAMIWVVTGYTGAGELRGKN
jgi:uncharacterized SAM-binding protein YcdF (DUF218 family)